MAPIVEIGSGTVPDVLQNLINSRGFAALDLTNLLDTLRGSRTPDGSKTTFTSLLLLLGGLDLALRLDFLIVTKEAVKLITLSCDLSSCNASRRGNFIIVVE